MRIQCDFRETEALKKRMNKAPKKLRSELAELQEKAAEELLLSLVKHAGGPPGPSIQTGEYVSSFRVMLKRFRGGFILGAENSSPQSHRLEYGFYGTDALGRNYADPPRPHFRPALIETQAWYFDQVRKILGDALG